MKTVALSFIVAASCLSCVAEEYRTKSSVVFDVIKDGKVVGSKRVRAGTVFDTVFDEQSKSARASAISPSTTTPAVFANLKTKTAYSFNAEVRLEHGLFYRPFTEETHHVFYLDAYNSKWTGRTQFYGYVKKGTSVEKSIMKIAESGDFIPVVVKIAHVDNEHGEDVVEILDVCKTKKPED